jgi:hypothetical protein
MDPKFKVPNRKVLTNDVLLDNYAYMLQNVNKYLSNASAISVTIDLWSDRRNRSFMG